MLSGEREEGRRDRGAVGGGRGGGRDETEDRK